MNKEHTTAQNMQAVNTEGIKFQRYPAYKDSGVEWLGEIPAHWGVEKLKFLSEMIVSNVDKHEKPLEIPVKLCNYVDVYKNDFITEEIDFMSATATKEEIDKFKVKIGDVLITKDSEDWQDIGVPSLVKHEAENLICGYHLAILRPKKEIIGSYLHRAMQSISAKTQLSINANGITRYGISQRAILSILLTIPPLPEQTRIATFLDHKTALIDQAIVQKERLIGLLQERRQVLIHRAVTRGLQPDVPMKDSGVEWIGEVPGHWGLIRSKFLFSKFEQGWSPQCFNYPANENQWGVLKVGCVNGFKFNPEENKVLPPNLIPKVEYKIKEGDILISRANTLELVGSAAVVTNLKTNLLLCDKLYRVTVKQNEVDPNYFVFYLKTKPARQQIELGANGASPTMQNIGQGIIKNMWITLPPLKEQIEISGHIDQQSAKIHECIHQYRKEINKLQEFKTTLIDAAVTGKVRV